MKQKAWNSLVAVFLAMAVGFSIPFPYAEAVEGGVVLSLPQLLEELRHVNPDIAAARKRWEAVQAKIPMATGLPAPKIGVEWEEIPRGTFKINKATAMYQLIQSLPFPGKRSLRQQVAVKEAQVAAFVFKQAQWSVTSQLKSAYYDLFLTDRESELQQEETVWLKQAVAAAQTRYATGAGSEVELLRAQAEALSASNQLTVLAHRRRAMEAHLNHLLNRPTHNLVGKPNPVRLVPVPSTPEELFVTAQQEQPELLALKFSVERSDAAWRLAKRELLPDLETMLELRDPAMGPIGPWDLSLALVLPFWFWTKEKYGVKVALYDKESTQAAYQAMQNEISKRIHEQWNEAQASYAGAKLAQDALIPLASQAVTSSLAAYQGGKGSFMEVMEALRNLSQQKMAYYKNLVDLEQRIVLLEQAVGAPLRAEQKGDS